MLSIVFLYKSDETTESVEAVVDAYTTDWAGTDGKVNALIDGVTNGEADFSSVAAKAAAVWAGAAGLAAGAGTVAGAGVALAVFLEA